MENISEINRSKIVATIAMLEKFSLDKVEEISSITVLHSYISELLVGKKEPISNVKISYTIF